VRSAEDRQPPAAAVMDRLLVLSHRGARAGAWGGGALVLLAAAVIVVDTLTRKLFDFTLGGASELSGYVLAISASWAFPLALLDRAHIRIDSLYVLLPTRARALLDILSLLTLLLFTGMLAWQGWLVFAQSFALGSRALTPIATPLEYPQFLWVLGLVYFVLVVFLLLLRSAIALVAGDLGVVQRIAGSRTAAQELEEELRSLHGRTAEDAGDRR
jgi:TRAP-type mannitol/chloroaromatic compound transport system permease small subunit